MRGLSGGSDGGGGGATKTRGHRNTYSRINVSPKKTTHSITIAIIFFPVMCHENGSSKPSLPLSTPV